MGSTNFTEYGEGTDPGAVYNRLVQQALHEHGNDAYNGSISTTGGFVVQQTTPVTLDEAYRIAEDSLDRYSKWEACGALPIVDDGQVKARVLNIVATYKGSLSYDDRQTFLDAEVKRQVTPKLKPGERVLSWTLDNPTWNGAAHVGGIEVERKVEVAVAKEDVETRYFVLDPRHGRSLPAWTAGHTTQSEARAAAVAAAETVKKSAFSDSGDIEFEVVALRRRASGLPLVKVTSRATKTTYPVSVKVGIVSATPTVKGWLFFGWVAI